MVFLIVVQAFLLPGRLLLTPLVAQLLAVLQGLFTSLGVLRKARQCPLKIPLNFGLGVLCRGASYTVVGLGHLVNKRVCVIDEVSLRDGGWAVPNNPYLEWLKIRVKSLLFLRREPAESCSGCRGGGGTEVCKEGGGCNE